MNKSLVALGVTKGRQKVTFCSGVLRFTVELVFPLHSNILQLGAACHCGVGSPQHSFNIVSLQKPDGEGFYNICMHKEKVGL